MSAHSDDDIIPFEPSTSPAPVSRPRPSALVGGSSAAPEARCPSCGYSMKGLRTLQCPECGKTASASRLGKGKDAGVAAQRSELVRIGVMLAVGIAGVLSVIGATGGLAGIVGYLIVFAISVPCGIAAYAMCCLLWVGFDEPLPIVAFKLAAIYAVVDLLGVLLNFIPILGLGIIKLMITGFTYVGLLMALLDLDQGDAIGVAIATFLVRLLVGLLLLLYVLPLLGFVI